MDCIKKPKVYNCIICNKKVHSADAGCCSVYRKERFNYASLCIPCAEAYDRLMSDVEIQPVLKFLLDKAYWRGVGPVIDF